MHECMKRLLAIREEDAVECLNKLMAEIGQLLDNPKTSEIMNAFSINLNVPTADALSVGLLPAPAKWVLSPAVT